MTVIVVAAVFVVGVNPVPTPIAVTVITDVPTATPVTMPAADTDATVGVPLA